jgi:hypothetical protein
MRALISYAGLVLATSLGLFFFTKETSPAPHSRVIAAYASRDLKTAEDPIALRAGSIDQIMEEGGGIHLIGWVAPFVDEIIFVPKKDGHNFVSRVGLIARSDVYSSFGTEDYLWSGVDFSVPNLSLSTLSCVLYSNATGATVMWSDGTQCKLKAKSNEFDFSKVEDVP